MRNWFKNLLLSLLKYTGVYYKTPGNFNLIFNCGFLSLFFLIMQIVTGIILAMFYDPDVNTVNITISNLTNDTYYGWWLRYIHANGSSFFFFVVYLHMGRNFYYGSFIYPRQYLWFSGSIIWILMIMTAFIGYVLPWGNMSFWAAMVITSLVGAIPLIGNNIIDLIWGNFMIDEVTLHRFFSLHFTLPFIIYMVAVIHFALLHEFGSGHPLGIPQGSTDHVPFIPYYTVKDFFVTIFTFIFLLYVIGQLPNWLLHHDNYNFVNIILTPPHIVPEWYFLPLYCVLRSVPSKIAGLLALTVFFLVIVLIPFLNKCNADRSGTYKILYNVAALLFFSNVICMGIAGNLPVLEPFYYLSKIFTTAHFVILLNIFPLLSFFERNSVKKFN